MGEVRVTTVVVEVARIQKSSVRVSHLALNVLRTDKQPIRVSHVFLNVLREHAAEAGGAARPVVFVVT